MKKVISPLNRITAVLLVLLLMMVFLPAVSSFSAGNIYYVSQNDGSDTNSGLSPDSAFLTIQKAVSVMQPGDTCYIREGVYREAVSISNMQGAETRFAAYEGEEVVISGGTLISEWQSEGNNIYSAPMDWEIYSGDGNMVFANGELCYEARWPNLPEVGETEAHPLLNRDTYAKIDSATESADSFTIYDSDLPTDDFTGAYLWCATGYAYWSYVIDVTENSEGRFKVNKTKNIFHEGCEPEKADNYYLMRHKSFLDSEGEWYRDKTENRLYYYTENAEVLQKVEAKSREYAINVANSSNVVFDGISVYGAMVKFGNSTTGCIFKNACVKSVDYKMMSGYMAGSANGFVLGGSNNTLASCEIKNMFGEGVTVEGESNRVLNCYVHNINFEHTYSDGIYISGKNHLVSRNTVKTTGRGTIGGRFDSCVLSYNDISDGSRISEDTGIVYFNAHDYKNSELHHNILHDSTYGDGIQLGLYLDSFSRGMVIYNNLIYNVEPTDGRNESTASNHLGPNSINTLFINNTFIDTDKPHITGNVEGSAYINNLFRGPGVSADKADELIYSCNLSGGGFWNNEIENDYTLKENSKAIDNAIAVPGITDNYTGGAPDCGAFEYGQEPWTAGCNLSEPYIDEKFSLNKKIPMRNLIPESGFENELSNDWELIGTPERFFMYSWEYFGHLTMDGDYSLYLDNSGDGIAGAITGLKPNAEYELKAYAALASEFHYATEEGYSIISGSINSNNPSGGITNGTVLMYPAVSFKNGEYDTMHMGLRYLKSGAKVEVRLDAADGTLLATFDSSIPEQLVSWRWGGVPIETVSGEHDLYLKFSGNFTDTGFAGFYFGSAAEGETITLSADNGSGMPQNIETNSKSFNRPVKMNVVTDRNGVLNLSVIKNGDVLKGYVDCISLTEKYSAELSGAILVNTIIRDTTGTAIDALQTGGLNIFEMHLRNRGGTEIPMMGILAIYDADNRLVKTSYFERTIRVGEEDKLLIGTVLPNIEGAYAKLFAWNNIDELKPIAQNVKFY